MSDDNIVLQEAIKQRWLQADSPKRHGRLAELAERVRGERPLLA